MERKTLEHTSKLDSKHIVRLGRHTPDVFIDLVRNSFKKLLSSLERYLNNLIHRSSRKEATP
jgi:hypothetical protein